MCVGGGGGRGGGASASGTPSHLSPVVSDTVGGVNIKAYSVVSVSGISDVSSVCVSTV